MNNTDRAKKFGRDFAESMFHDFYKHPDYRGPNFTWSKFPLMASRLAEVSCFLHFRHGVKRLPYLEKACKNACLETAKKLVKQNTLLED